MDDTGFVRMLQGMRNLAAKFRRLLERQLLGGKPLKQRESFDQIADDVDRASLAAPRFALIS